MPNMNPKKNPMPHQDPVVRAGNFEEVALGYTKEQATRGHRRGTTLPPLQEYAVRVRLPGPDQDS